MKYVALLRGISPMNAPSAKLQAVFEELGFSDVKTIISSGNVVFSDDTTDINVLEKRIEHGLRTKLSLTGAAIVRTSDQIHEFIDTAPFGDQKHGREHYQTVTFLKHQPEQLPRHYFYYDVTNQAICEVHDATQTKTPDFMTKLEKEFGKEITTRTWNTVIRISNKLAE